MTLLLSACSQLMKGEEQPVRQFRDINTYKTACGGAVETWGSCYAKAKRTCSNGYEVVEQDGNSTGTVRTMVFTCNK